jgi:hypothetical protein
LTDLAYGSAQDIFRVSTGTEASGYPNMIHCGSSASLSRVK